MNFEFRVRHKKMQLQRCPSQLSINFSEFSGFFLKTLSLNRPIFFQIKSCLEPQWLIELFVGLAPEKIKKIKILPTTQN